MQEQVLPPDAIPDGVNLQYERGHGWIAWRWTWTDDAGTVYMSPSYGTPDAAVDNARVFIAALKEGRIKW